MNNSSGSGWTHITSAGPPMQQTVKLLIIVCRSADVRDKWRGGEEGTYTPNIFAYVTPRIFGCVVGNWQDVRDGYRHDVAGCWKAATRWGAPPHCHMKILSAKYKCETVYEGTRLSIYHLLIKLSQLS